MKKVKLIITNILLFAATFLFAYFAPFSGLDFFITDRLYSQLRVPSRDIVILSIDSNTLNEYGNFVNWSREKTADALYKLYEDEDKAPAVVGIDITFQGDYDEETDKRLGKAIEQGNVVLSETIFFKGKTEVLPDGRMVHRKDAINLVERPTEVVAYAAKLGFTNAYIDKDGVARYYRTDLDYEGDKLYSFAYVIANEYANATGKEVKIPKTSGGLFRFFYAGKNGEIQHFSLNRFLNDEIPADVFAGKIVLIGAYATGMQDNYHVTKDVGTEMYGVEVQANAIQAYFDGATAVNANRLLYSLILALIACCVLVLSSKSKLFVAILVPVLGIAINTVAGVILSKNGYLISQVYADIVFVVVIAYVIIKKYVVEANKRRHITKVFGRYMEPKLVAAMAKGDTQALKLGGDRREVAVLFVDVRGFTKMSEALEPEEVVGILNEYLGLVTECILRHGGMLDKFVGDCAMAVFNAPIDQEDYLYKAVATAWDIAQGYEVLAKSLNDRFGRSVSYGIGVNCGPAVVGNIGCDFRMDYTAIGDTVNTAARLEANAETGQILISKAVKEALEGRIEVSFNGMMQFKGKANPQEVYRVEGLK